MNEHPIYDCIMIGAGPAALTAAIYTTRENITTLLVEKGAIGGLAATTDFIENYPGFAEGIDGIDLGDKFRAQAERFGAKFELGAVQAVSKTTDGFAVTVEGQTINSKTVLVASGSDYRKLGIPGEKEFFGRGVSYCATCDGPLFKDKKIVVVGGGNSAAQEALFLSRFSKDLTVLVRGVEFKASEILVNRIKADSNIKVFYNVTTQEIISRDNKVTAIKGINNQNNEAVEYPADGIFVFIGLVPNTGFLADSGVELDEFGFVKTDLHLSTNVKGIFAAGDVRLGANRQVVSAAGEGATAALSIREYLESLN